MNRSRTFKILYVTGLLVAGSVSALSAHAAGEQIDQLIIHYHHDVQARMNRSTDPQLMARTAEKNVTEATGLQVSYKRSMAKITGAHVLRLPYAMDVEQAKMYASQLVQNEPDIDYAEPDYRRYLFSTTPNDEKLGGQWHLKSPDEFAGAANVFNAWDITKGSADIVVAILDAGITNHIDLQPNLVGGSAEKSGYDMVPDDAAGVYPSGDGDGRDSDPSDPGIADSSAPCVAPESGADNDSRCWHGTHIAGLIAARPDNGKFVAGVGWNTRLSVVRVFSEKSGYVSDQVDGMAWAAGETVAGVPENKNPARVINLSAGSDGYDCSITEQNAIDDLRGKGVSIVVAAGNKNHNVSGSAPANCDGVISVTGVMKDGARTPFANYGVLNDIAAPAKSIVSTLDSGERQPVGDSIGAISGTSQAAPQVSGVLALMLAANNALLDESVIPASKLADLLENKLKRAARPFPDNAGYSNDPKGCNENQEHSCVCSTETCGAGLLDAMQAVKSVSTAPTARTGDSRDIPAETLTTLDGSGSSDDTFGGKVVSYQWEQVSGPDVVLTDADKAKATFTAPSAGSSNTQLAFELKVTDDVGLQDSKQVILAVPKRSGGGGTLPLSVLLGLLGLFGLRRLVWVR
uniref:Peptidase S8/S53 domain-containing protein n=1 Tax=uncultured Thiotrichaceae bacterium TaxID=298394 RepID=A0A6S6UJ81_9GAMM|nr:MAG: Unknown protein [uncultured Thiotrichaceae bacterium]